MVYENRRIFEVNGIVVRYDGGHFTGTQSRALAPLLDEKLRAIGIDLSNL